MLFRSENLDLIVDETLLHPEIMNLLVDIALNSNYPRRWRAAWVADKINDRCPEFIDPYLKDFIAALDTELSPGIKRHILKLISMHEIPEVHLSFLLNYCLKCFASPGEPVAVRVHAMQILYNISEKEPEFKPELLTIIQHEAEIHATPGIRSRGNKLTKKLHQEISRSGIHFI